MEMSDEGKRPVYEVSLSDEEDVVDGVLTHPSPGRGEERGRGDRLDGRGSSVPAYRTVDAGSDGGGLQLVAREPRDGRSAAEFRSRRYDGDSHAHGDGVRGRHGDMQRRKDGSGKLKLEERYGGAGREKRARKHEEDRELRRRQRDDERPHRQEEEVRRAQEEEERRRKQRDEDERRREEEERRRKRDEDWRVQEEDEWRRKAERSAREEQEWRRKWEEDDKEKREEKREEERRWKKQEEPRWKLEEEEEPRKQDEHKKRQEEEERRGGDEELWKPKEEEHVKEQKTQEGGEEERHVVEKETEEHHEDESRQQAPKDRKRVVGNRLVSRSSMQVGNDHGNKGRQDDRKRRRDTTQTDDQQRKPDYRALLHQLYEEYNPQKLSDIDALLRKYAGQEAEMYQRICQKYGVPVVTTASSGRQKQDPLLQRYQGLLQRGQEAKGTAAGTGVSAPSPCDDAGDGADTGNVPDDQLHARFQRLADRLPVQKKK